VSQRKLARNISVMSSAIFVSRIVGLVRDQVMAFFFGTTFLNDAFLVGFKIPNLLRSLFGEGALSASFVPIYNELGIREGKQRQVTFALQVLSLLTVFLLVLTLVGMALTPIIVKLLYPGLPQHTYLLAVKLTRIMFPYLFWIGLSSTLIAILNSHDYFFMTGLSSALLNVGMIASIVLPYRLFGVRGEALVWWAAWGVFGGGFLQTLINFPYLRKLGYPLMLMVRFGGEALSTMWKRFIPSLIGVGIREINLIADSLMASFLVVGSISALEYGNRLFQLPLGIFAISTGTALLPSYSRLVTQGDYEELSRHLRFAAVSLAYVILPVTTLILALGGDFVRILFQRGAFDDRAALMTTQALLYYSIGLIFFSLNQTLTPLFYANKDTRTPVKIAAWMVAVNIVLNFILMQFMQHRGLALSTSLTAVLNYFLLLHLIQKSMPQISFRGIAPNIGKSALICLILWFLLSAANRSLAVSGLFGLIAKDAVFAFFAVVFFYLMGLALRLDYLRQALQFIWKRRLS
jgi:putative peptidoglycan lipid II flippase